MSIGDVARGRHLQIVWRDLSSLVEDGVNVTDRLALVENELFGIEQNLAAELPPKFLKPDGTLCLIEEIA